MNFLKRVICSVLILFLLFVVLVIFFKRNIMNFDEVKSDLEGYISTMGKESHSLIECGETIQNNFTNFGNDISVLSSSKYLILSSDMKKKLEFNHNFSFPIVKNSNLKSLIFDSNGQNYIITNKYKILNKGNVENKIIMGAISEKDNFVLITESDEYCCEVRVLKTSGKDVYRYCFAKSYVTGVTINDIGDKVAVCTLSSEENKIKSAINIFDFKSENAIFSKEFEDNIFLYIDFFDNEDFMAIGNNLSVSVVKLGKKINKVDYQKEDLCLYSFDKKYGVALSFSPTNDQRNQYVIILDKNCHQKSKIETDKRLKFISLNYKTVFALSETQLLILKNNKISLQKRIPVSCQKVLKISNSELCALGQGEISKIKY